MKKTRQIARRRLITTMVVAGVVPWHRLVADDKLLLPSAWRNSISFSVKDSAVP